MENVLTGGWCRPQTDGPALAAGALATYGLLKQAAGEETDYLWGLVTHDLEWVQGNWRSVSADLLHICMGITRISSPGWVRPLGGGPL